MTLPPILNEQFVAARSMISRANFVDVNMNIHNAKAMLKNARAFVVEAGDIGPAFDQAARDIGALRDVHDLDDWRASALAALDRLEQSLTGVRSNDYADALGVGWF